MAGDHRRRVLHSMPPPGEDTRYATHMAAVDSAEFEMCFFSWRRALWGDYDIFHLHWPEQLLGRERGPGGLLRWLRALALLRRLRRRGTPVVYTLHNHAPHDTAISARLRAVRRRLAELTRVEIHLVPEPDYRPPVPTVVIPHGHYRQPFAKYPIEEPIPGRILFFGILKPYKNVAALVTAFRGIEDAALSLRIVGEPRDGVSVAAVDAARRADPRVAARYGFIPDRDLVAEVRRACLVVLPYTELHSSGAALVALSLNRPVLLPSSPTADALREETGPGWVHTFVPPLTSAALQSAATTPLPSSPPRLHARDWSTVRDAHTNTYRAVLDCARRTPRTARSPLIPRRTR